MKPDFTLQFKKETFHVRISPCSWMYPGHKIQIGISLKENAPNIATIFQKSETMEWDKENHPAMLKEARNVTRNYLKEHGRIELDKAEKKHQKLNREWEIHQEKELQEQKKREIRLINKGFTHRLDAWIHPSHDSDFQIKVYFMGEPTKTEVQKQLKKCQVKTDYKVSILVKDLT
jgi:hypothetical protein